MDKPDVVVPRERRQTTKLLDPDKYTYEPAKILRMDIGSVCHEHRSFFTILFGGVGPDGRDTWGMGRPIPFNIVTIDKLIEICGVNDLFACLDAHLRVGRLEQRGDIMALAHRVPTRDLILLLP